MSKIPPFVHIGGERPIVTDLEKQSPEQDPDWPHWRIPAEVRRAYYHACQELGEQLTKSRWKPGSKRLPPKTVLDSLGRARELDEYAKRAEKAWDAKMRRKTNSD